MKNEIIKRNIGEIIDFTQIDESFADYLDVSELTLKAYRAGIRSFLDYTKKNNIKYPTRTDLKAYREELREEKSVYTVNSYLTAIRELFRYLEDKGLYQDITKNVKNLCVSYCNNADILSAEEMKQIYSKIEDLREKAIFGLAITTGLRANEIATAKIENIKEHNGEIVLYVKCKKRADESEYVKLSPKIIEDLREYIGNRTVGSIFVSNSKRNNGCGITNQTVRHVVKKILKDNGIEKDWVSCHTLRRSMATLAYENGEDLLSIQRVLHHSSTAVTQRYIQQSVRNNNKLEYKVSDLIFG